MEPERSQNGPQMNPIGPRTNPERTLGRQNLMRYAIDEQKQQQSSTGGSISSTIWIRYGVLIFLAQALLIESHS